MHPVYTFQNMFKWCHMTKWLYNKFFCKFYAMQKRDDSSPQMKPLHYSSIGEGTFKSPYNVLENGNESEDTG